MCIICSQGHVASIFHVGSFVKKTTHSLGEGNYSCLGDGIVREFGVDMYTLLYLKGITNEDLLYSPRNSAECHVATEMGGEFGKEWIHVHV